MTTYCSRQPIQNLEFKISLHVPLRDFLFRLGDEFGDRHGAEILASSPAYRNTVACCFAFADHQQIRNFCGFGFGDLGIDLIVPQVLFHPHPECAQFGDDYRDSRAEDVVQL